MIETILKPEIHALIEAKDFAKLKATLGETEVHDLSTLLRSLEDEDLALVFRLVSTDRAAEALAELEVDQRENLLRALSSEKVASIVNEMAPDDRTELLEELPGEVAQRLLTSLTGDKRKIALSLLAYPEDSIGRLMTPEYLAIRSSWTVEEVFAHIRKAGATKETLNVIYVVDDRWKLLDELQLEKLILAEPAEKVSDLMDYQFAFLQASDDQEDAVEIFKKYDAVALPVVNSQGILVGIVTFDDVMDVAEEEDTEDFQKLVAVTALESSYFQTSYAAMLRKRLPWLALLFAAELLTVMSIGAFERTMGEQLLLLVIFMPLVNASAGNAGSQMAGLVIRGLAVQEMDAGDWLRVCWRELRMGLTLGLALSAAAFVTPLAFGKPWYVGVALCLAMIAALTVANLAGAMIPLALKRMKLDPAVTSTPLIASMMDVLSAVIFFSIGLGVLNAMQ